MTTLHLDLESRSTVDLKKAGTYLYATHPSTDIWCVAYATDDAPVELWVPGQPLPDNLKSYIANGGSITAHNAMFERLMWWYVLMPRYGWPKPKIEQFRCTMTMALAMSLPGSLENAAGAVGLTIGKDMKGHRRMMQMSKPRDEDWSGKPTWWDDQPRREELYAYCKQDVEVERALDKRLLNLSQKEQELWWLDQRINDRGVSVDLSACRNAVRHVDRAKDKLDERMRQVTSNAVASTNAVAQIVSYLSTVGVTTDSIGKDDLLKLLDRDDLPEKARAVLELRQEGSKSSTAKLQAMINSSDTEGRSRGVVQYHAASTGRWGGRLWQPHNLIRDMLHWEDVERFFSLLPRKDGGDAIEFLLGPVPSVVSKCLRAFVVAKEDHELLVSDFSSIEACVLPWLAGQEDALEALRRGEDMYNKAAADVYGRKIDRKNVKADEAPGQVGKVIVLALGYEGGIAAFAQFAKNLRVDMATVYPTLWGSATPEERKNAERAYAMYKARSSQPVSLPFGLASDIVKQRWRAKNDRIKQYWRDLNDAALAAVRSPGQTFSAGAVPVRYKVSGSFLWCQLPSKRALCYPYPKIGPTRMPWDNDDGTPVYKDAVRYKGVNEQKQWGDHFLYGGLLAENVTQAVARDLLAEAMVRAESAGFPVVLHVHDEVIAELPIGNGDIKEFDRVMCQLPEWAAGCPVTAKGFRTRRYRK